MSTATVTPKGRVLLKKRELRHLGVQPGQHISVQLLPGGRLELASSEYENVTAFDEPTGSIENFIGILKGKSSKVATIDEIREAAERGWAGLDDIG